MGLINTTESLTTATGETRLVLPPHARVTVVIHRQGYSSRMFDVNPDTVRRALHVVLSKAPQPTSYLCSADYRPGIRVRITGAVLRDSVTVWVVAQDGSYADSSSANAQDLRRGIAVAHERAGTYTVTVSAAGYGSWQRHGVRVPLSDPLCGRIGLLQMVEAELTARP